MYKANGPHAQYGLSQLHSNNILNLNSIGLWDDDTYMARDASYICFGSLGRPKKFCILSYSHDILIIVSELNVCLTFGKFLPYHSITQTSTLPLWNFAGTGAKDLSIGIQ